MNRPWLSQNGSVWTRILLKSYTLIFALNWLKRGPSPISIPHLFTHHTHRMFLHQMKLNSKRPWLSVIWGGLSSKKILWINQISWWWWRNCRNWKCETPQTDADCLVGVKGVSRWYYRVSCWYPVPSHVPFEFGGIHKPCGQFFGDFWSPPFVDHFTK